MVYAILTLLIIDEIDKVILSSLSKNARIPAVDIANNLKNTGYKITERAIRYRLRRLEQNNIVLGYSAIFNPSLTSEKISRTIMLKFRFTKDSHILMRCKVLPRIPLCFSCAVVLFFNHRSHGSAIHRVCYEGLQD